MVYTNIKKGKHPLPLKMLWFVLIYYPTRRHYYTYSIGMNPKTLQ